MKNTLVGGKIRVTYFIMFLAAGLLLMFAFKWQVAEGTRFQREAESRNESRRIPSLRGTIYAADGSTLAYSEPRYNVFIYMPELEFAERLGLQTRAEFVTKVAPLVDTTPEKLTKLIEDESRYRVWFKIADAVTIEAGTSLKNLRRDKDSILPLAQRGRLIGHVLPFTAKRIYPEQRLAAQVLGITEVDDHDGQEIKTVGLDGLERSWNGILEPIAGIISGETDARGNAVGLAAEKTLEAKRGSSLYTSINKQVQRAIERRIKWGVETYDAEAGSIVVIEPKTGRIIAMANYPSYNPNTREADAEGAFVNAAVTQPYEIGSVGKAFTLSAALDLGTVKPQTVLLPDGHEGCEEVTKEFTVCTAGRVSRGALAISEAFKLSDNLYFLHLANTMPKEDYYEYLRKFGIGRATGIDLPGESHGPLKDPEKWNKADVAAYSYGHSYQDTLLQAANGYAAIANYGVRMQPQIVTKVEEANGRVKEYEPIALERVISRDTALKMDQIMYDTFLVNSTEWYYRELHDYKIAIKSGTAQIPYRDRAGYSNEYNATYIGYDASPDRTFVMAVRLVAPQVGDYSSDNARITWIEGFRDIKGILGVRKMKDY